MPQQCSIPQLLQTIAIPGRHGLVTMHDTQSISTKVTYAKGKGLLGFFAWQLAQDPNSVLSKTGMYESNYLFIIIIM